MYAKGYSVVIHESAIKDIIFHCVKSIRIRDYSGTQGNWSKSRKYLYLQNVQINRLNKLKFLHYSRPELMKLTW